MVGMASPLASSSHWCPASYCKNMNIKEMKVLIKNKNTNANTNGEGEMELPWHIKTKTVNKQMITDKL